jgi:hypothetical protein
MTRTTIKPNPDSQSLGRHTNVVAWAEEAHRSRHPVGTWEKPPYRCDALSLVRYEAILQGCGRRIDRLPQSQSTAVTHLSAKHLQFYQSVTGRLADWCRKHKWRPCVEVITRARAKRYLRHLSQQGLAARTIKNHRNCLEKLWAAAACADTAFASRPNIRLCFKASLPLPNVWRGLRTDSPSRGSAVPRGLRSLADGPAAAKRKAEDNARLLRRHLKSIEEGGITTLHGIARALNERGERTPRSKLWDATAVRRLKSRLAAMKLREKSVQFATPT